jgi:hypothetical protein
MSPRDRHLFGPGPKRILSLDGGGVRGVITLAFLERLEQIIEEIEGKPVRLGDWFDMIGGTSTGAIIATALSLGYSAAEVHEFYKQFAPRTVQRSYWRIPGLRARFDARAVERELKSVIGDRTLDSEDLRTGLCVITKRMDTGSPWIVMNNPRSAFWDTPPDKSFIGNRHYPLVNVVRASTAAPNYFDPEPIQIIEGMKPGLFVDGGVSPHNNPSLYLFLAAALPPYRLRWALGPQNLTIVSVGTGSYRYRVSEDDLPWFRTLGIALHALVSELSDSQQLVLALMSWFGRSPTRWTINSELGDLGEAPPPLDQPLFNFLRYDVQLDDEWLGRELGVKLPPKTLASYRLMEAAANMPAIYELGRQAAERQVRREHLVPTGRA